MSLSPKLKAKRSIKLHLALGVIGVALLVGGVGGWAMTAEISGAVIAPGSLVVETNVKKLQHPTGGVVGELRVRDGDHVRMGQVLLRLDETQTRANLAIVTKALDEHAARQARQLAERDDANAPRFPAELLARLSDPAVAEVLEGESRLFEIRRLAREGRRSQLRERVGQLKEEMQGVTQQVNAKERETKLIQKELEGVRELFSKSLVPINKLTALERDAARIEGERGQLLANIAQTKGKVTETELQIVQIDQDLRTEVGKDLADIRSKVSELSEKKITAEDQLKRIDLRAPQDGVVHQLSIHTVGEIVIPNDPILLIVPAADNLIVEVKIQPQDIDHVRHGQKTVLRFPAFSQRTTPELNGKVTRVSADVSQDKNTGMTFYTARISMDIEELARLGDLRLISGMPVESFIQTGDRTAMSYLVKPFSDQIKKAFREI